MKGLSILFEIFARIFVTTFVLMSFGTVANLAKGVRFTLAEYDVYGTIPWDVHNIERYELRYFKQGSEEVRNFKRGLDEILHWGPIG